MSILVPSNAENYDLLVGIEKTLVALSTKLDFYQRELVVLHERLTKLEVQLSKLESFKSVLTALALIGPFVGALAGIIVQRFLL